jgi:hypothetical protein
VDEYLPNDIDGVNDDHMEGKHLKIFLENFGNWLARTSFVTKQKISLGNKSKEKDGKIGIELEVLRSSMFL